MQLSAKQIAKTDFCTLLKENVWILSIPYLLYLVSKQTYICYLCMLEMCAESSTILWFIF
jgi:hypothetical protein